MTDLRCQNTGRQLSRTRSQLTRFSQKENNEYRKRLYLGEYVWHSPSKQRCSLKTKWYSPLISGKEPSCKTRSLGSRCFPKREKPKVPQVANPRVDILSCLGISNSLLSKPLIKAKIYSTKLHSFLLTIHFYSIAFLLKTKVWLCNSAWIEVMVL